MKKDYHKVTISTEWKRNKTWGWNPHTVVIFQDKNDCLIGHTTGRASGCGYDKLSTAITEALNKSEDFRKFVYKRLPKEERSKYFHKDMTLSTEGRGANEIVSLFRLIGFKLMAVSHGTSYDLFCFIKSRKTSRT